MSKSEIRRVLSIAPTLPKDELEKMCYGVKGTCTECNFQYPMLECSVDTNGELYCRNCLPKVDPESLQRHLLETIKTYLLVVTSKDALMSCVDRGIKILLLEVELSETIHQIENTWCDKCESVLVDKPQTLCAECQKESKGYKYPMCVEHEGTMVVEQLTIAQQHVAKLLQAIEIVNSATAVKDAKTWLKERTTND